MTQVLPDLPYRGMKSFRLIDRNIYAGRDSEIQKISKLLLLYRGLLIYGDSGVGKSSLMNAGVFPALLEDEFQPEVLRLNPDLNGTFVVSKIKRNKTEYQPSIFDQFKNTEATESRKINVSFREFKETLRKLDLRNRSGDNDGYPPPDRSVVLIFDQFEELITLFEEDTRFQVNINKRRQLQNLIVQLLTRCYFSQTLPVKLVFVFREDYLAKFSRLFKAIPDLRDHYLRIKPLQTAQAAGIIFRPFDDAEKQQHFPQPFTPDLIQKISDKITAQYPDGNLDLTELQIVCLQLYNLQSQQQRETAIQQHSVADLLQNFYLDLLNSLDEKERPVAIDILSLMVLNEKTRNIFHKDAIVHHLPQYPAAVIEAAIDKLENNIKIIRREIREGGIYYEIVSEAMIPYINKKKIEKEKEEERQQQAAADAQEAKRKNAVKRVVLGMGFILLLLAGYTLFYYHAIRVEKKKQRIAAREKEWFQKIPRQELRDRIIDTLLQLDKTDTAGYNNCRYSFAIAADSYDYIKKSEYSSALATAFLGYIYNRNNITRQILDSILGKTILPAVNLPVAAGSNTTLNRVLAGKNGVYFLVYSNGRMEVNNYLHAVPAQTIDAFINTRETHSIPVLSGTRPVQPAFAVPALTLVPTGNGSYVYLFYRDNRLALLDAGGQLINSLQLSSRIALVCSFAADHCLVVNTNGSAGVYALSGNNLRLTQQVQLPDAPRQDFYPHPLTAGNYFAYDQVLYYADSTGMVTTKYIDTTELITDINRRSLLLLDEKNNDKNKIRYQRNVTELPGFPAASLAADTNLVVNCYFDKAYITSLVPLPNNIEQHTRIISDLPDNFTPTLSPGGRYVLLRNYPDMYTVCNLATGEKKYLFVNGSTSGTAINHPGRSFASSSVFLNDSMVAVYNQRGARLFNLAASNTRIDADEQNEWLANNSLPLYQKYIEDNGNSNSVFMRLFPVQYLEQEIPKAYNNRKYDSAIQLSYRLLAITNNTTKRQNCFQYLYNAYYNQLLDLDATPQNAAKQLYFARIIARYTDSLQRLAARPEELNNLRAKTLGSLSWYLLLNHLYPNALDTCRLALRIDSFPQKQQWINTNLALSYLFNNDKASALKVYQYWKNRYFNDDLATGKVRFLEDLSTLSGSYQITVPYKEAVLQLLNK